MTDVTKKRGKGRPPGSPNKVTATTLTRCLPDPKDIKDLAQVGLMDALVGLNQMSKGEGEFRDASCTNKLGAMKELLAFGLKVCELEKLQEDNIKDKGPVDKVEDEPEANSTQVKSNLLVGKFIE